MPIDQVRFCVDKYLKGSYGWRPASSRPDLAEAGRRLVASAKAVGAGDVLGVQTVDETSDDIAFVVTENGLVVKDAVAYLPYRSIVRLRTDYQDKQDFRAIDIELEDCAVVRLNVESGHGKLRDAFPVSRFLGHLLGRLKQTHPAYRSSAS